jgi:CheY-like chemotaxis protein
MLVVDDEDFVATCCARFLKVNTATFMSRRMAAKRSRLFREMEFDGVFTDVGMPGMSGWELAREIRQINTADSDRGDYRLGRAVGSNEQKAAGVDWVIAKPFTADRIAELVRDIRCPQPLPNETVSAGNQTLPVR